MFVGKISNRLIMLNYILKVYKRYFFNQCLDDVIHPENENMLPLILLSRPTQNSLRNVVYCIISYIKEVNTSVRHMDLFFLTIYSLMKAFVLFNLV